MMMSVMVSDGWMVTQWSVVVKGGKEWCQHLETWYLDVVKSADHIPNLGEGSPTIVGWSASGQ